MARHYDLVLMLDPEAEDKARDGVSDEARKLIESAAEIEHSDSWGLRKLAFEIRQRTEADYRYFRFATDDNELLNRLDHSLKIADGVLRFRLFRVEPTTPTTAPPSSDRPAAVPGDRERR
jgi:small subunit ribosomal protein S6